MTPRLQNLIALRDAVKEGRDEIDMFPAFPDVKHRNLIALILTPDDMRATGAALAFHAAVLPGWAWCIQCGAASIWPLFGEYDRAWDVPLFTSEQKDNPALALFLADMAALIAIEEGK